MIQLRDYQAGAVDALRRQIRQGAKRLCLVAPTGAGKTTIAAEIIKGSVARQNPVLFIAHRTELIEQASARLDLYGIDHGIIKAGTLRAKPRAVVQIASIQTLSRRQLPPARLIIVDETHRVLGASYLKVLSAYPDAIVIGLTATPIRLDGRGLGDVFEGLVEAAKIEDLVAQGVLLKPKIYAPPGADLSGVKTVAGDYNQAELAKVVDEPTIVGDIVAHWFKHAFNKRTVVFASSVQHSIHIAETFQQAGVIAAHISGETPADERAQTLQDFRRGSIRVVVNCGVLIEGWDCPDAFCAVLARPTQSLSMYLQMVGRVLRTADGKEGALILDHAGCVHKHGTPWQAREWSLEVTQKKEPGASIKSCPACFAVVESAVSECPECQHVWTRKENGGREMVVAGEGELEEYNGQPTTGAAPVQSWLKRFVPAEGHKPTKGEKTELFAYLKSIADRKGYKDGWVSHQYRSVFGVWPRGITS